MACLKLANKYNDQIANVKFGSGLASKMLCVHEGSRDHVANTRNDLGRHMATQVTLALRFNYVKKTDAIGYIPNQTNEYLYPQSILTYTQVCTHYTQVTHGPTHRYTQECKSCATSKTWVPPKGVITIHVDDTWSHIFLPNYD